MKKYILSLDQGTTSSRAVLFDRTGAKVFSAQYEFPQIYPQAGWVEHDPAEIWDTQLHAAKDCIAYLEEHGESITDIAGIGVANQRETAILWNKHTGEPIHNAIVWQCRRTADDCRHLTEQGLETFFRKKTGLLIDPYFSATKIKWMLDHADGARELAERGELLFGTVDTWLIWKLTGGSVHATDYSNASRTMLFNIHSLEWDREILGLLGIPESILPEVRPSSGDFGQTAEEVLGAPLPLCGCAGDQQAALFGQCCFHKGDVKNTYGTGGFLLMNTGSDCIESQSGLLTTIAWGVGGKITYALEGSVFVSGAVIKWLRDEMQLIRTAEETAAIAESVPDNGGVYFVPAFVGLGTPYWNSGARGLICGLTRGTGRAHIIRAALEAIAYQTADVIRAMETDTGALGRIKADGGAAQNDFLMQFQADILGRSIIRPDNVESTAAGAAYLAGLCCGMWDSIGAVSSVVQELQEFRPVMQQEERSRLTEGWNTAVQRAMLS